MHVIKYPFLTFAVLLLSFFLFVLAPHAAKRGLVVNQVADFSHDSKQLGAFKALIIGINDYVDPKIPDLTTAVIDAQAVAKTLRDDYGFTTTQLLNNRATKSNIYKALRKLAEETEDGDSVLIYYAGHGDLDKVYNDGWWIPSDAKGGDPLSYLDNVQVQKSMRSMKARHVLLVSDSCYSGTLFGTTRALPPVIDNKHYLGLYNDRSRWGLTSGNREPVADLGGGKHSIFANQLLKELRRSDRAFFSIRDVYTRIAPVIANNSEQHPICRPIQGVGDEGGEFVFVRVAGGTVVTDKPIPAKPVKKTGMLTVQTEPAKATVYINGSNEGLAPIRIQDLDPGLFTIEARKTGYQIHKEEARVRAGRSTELLLVLDANVVPMGRLYVSATPSDAQIRILNIEPRYAEGMELEPGRYHLEVSRNNFHTASRWVELKADEKLKVEVALVEVEKEPLPPKEIIKEVIREKIVVKEVIVEVPKEIIVEVPVSAEPKPSGPFLGPSWKEPITGMEFIWIKGGCYKMGSPASEAGRDGDEQQHKVCVDGFYLGKKEVSQAEWQEIMGSNPSKYKTSNSLPVERVSWDDAQVFLGKLTDSDKVFRLPSEAEWEYAARAGSSTPFFTGAALSSKQANYDGNHPYGNTAKGKYPRKTMRVGSYPANGWGLYDMHGNVWEWVNDWYGEEYYTSSPQKNPAGPSSSWYRVIRGGGWYSFAKGCRSANRDWNTPDENGVNIGFRVVLAPGQ